LDAHTNQDALFTLGSSVAKHRMRQARIDAGEEPSSPTPGEIINIDMNIELRALDHHLHRAFKVLE
jgi:hypothetical protein